ncbi:MAG TPA: hypothetical protein VKR58_01615, partial [Aquella sp.]|nr:hypothetical protein [Aquella sp.]
FQVRNQLKDPNDYLTKLKYEALKKKYVDKIKGHAIGSLVGLAMTVAVSIIFLFPQIGLGAIGTAAFVVAGVKLTVAGIACITAGCALTIPLLPTVYGFAKWGLSKIGNGINNGVKKLYSFFKSKVDKEQKSDPIISNEHEKQQQASIRNIIKPSIPTAHNSNFKIKDEHALNNAINHDIKFNAFSKHSRFRETIIDHIEDKNLATTALQKMVNKKIESLAIELEEGKTGDYLHRYSAEKQRPKREQKLYALLLIKQQLRDSDENVFEKYLNCFKDFSKIHQNRSKFNDVGSLINYIESSLPGVTQSFFLDQSDTQNIIEALKVYAYKFSENNIILDNRK